jgi:hypothetical protein
MGFLCNDQTGGSYYLTQEVNTYINSHSKYFDAETQLWFIHSIARLEGTNINVSTLETLEYQNHLPIFEFFTHQDQFTTNVKNKMLAIGDWLNSNDFVNEFTQYVLKA